MSVMLTWLEWSDSFADALHYATSLMAQDTWEQTLRVMTFQGVGISVTNTSSNNLCGALEEDHIRIQQYAEIIRRNYNMCICTYLQTDT